MCSVPMESRTVLGAMPAACCSSSLIWPWVVLAGWMTRLFTSATLASWENIFSRSQKAIASRRPPLMLQVKMDPAPWGKYRWYSSWQPHWGRLGWLTDSTLGWPSRNSTTARAFWTWRSTRRERVSSPWSSRKAWKGERQAPRSRSSTPWTRVR